MQTISKSSLGRFNICKTIEIKIQLEWVCVFSAMNLFFLHFMKVKMWERSPPMRCYIFGIILIFYRNLWTTHACRKCRYNYSLCFYYRTFHYTFECSKWIETLFLLPEPWLKTLIMTDIFKHTKWKRMTRMIWNFDVAWACKIYSFV